jgi:hypothetical protein
MPSISLMHRLKKTPPVIKSGCALAANPIADRDGAREEDAFCCCETGAMEQEWRQAATLIAAMEPPRRLRFERWYAY